ncbi:MAG TPA: DUF996 domain-containing protein [Conexivisphaerales archaeon]|nr:DUF996 domain-containing protein [Conexivisphaerales archaeon]
MTLLTQARTYGGIGSVLIILGAVPSVGWILALAGFILVLLAVKYVSDTLNDRSVLNNMLISVVASIVGVIVAGIFIFASVMSFVGWNFSSISSIGQSGTYTSGDIMSLIFSVIVGLAVVWIALIVAAIYLRRSYSVIASKLNVKMFDTTALLYLIGAATAIILIGFVLILVAEILQILAFFNLPENYVPAGPSPPMQPM